LGRFFATSPRVDPEVPEPVMVAEIGAHRRALHHQRFLEQLLASSPRPEVVGNIDEIRRSIEALSEESEATLGAPQLIAKVFARSADSELRMACLRALQHLNLEEARNELYRLSQDPGTGDGWRALCQLYLSSDPGPVVGGASGGQ
jgi:hypothetical protein